MLEKTDLKKMVPRDRCKELTEELRAQLSALQQPVKKSGLPVLLLFEGWGAAGKGGLISDLILNFDPRGCKVYSFIQPTALERREPFLWRYWKSLPAKGQIAVLDRSWYQDVTTARLEENLDSGEVKRRLNEINIMERQLTDAGYLIVKFFIHIGRKEQKERFENLVKNKNTAWRVTEQDWKRNRQYEKYEAVFDETLGYTDTARAPWNVVSGTDRKSAALEIFQIVANSIDDALQPKPEEPPHPGEAVRPGVFQFLPMPSLSSVTLDKSLEKKEYRRRLKENQRRLGELHEKLYLKKVPLILAFEGWDAAGKGGNIRRIAKALDPRGYAVVPISSPSPEEAAHHYLWRFWKNLPRDGHVAIFDRSWYGRVLVERVEGFCTEDDWRRAYREINEFERQLTDWGAVILKFWLQIDKDEQLRRFKARENTPSKQWKITQEDWRNREKWDQYEICAGDMLKYTSTASAPWIIVESQDKKYARIKTLDAVIDAVEQKFHQR